MGYSTHFYGTLRFTRKLAPKELRTLDRIMRAGQQASPEIEAIVNREFSKGGRFADSNIGTGWLRAQLQGFAVEPNLRAGYAGDLRVTDDGQGLEYCSEKTYDMVGGVNFIIVNGRRLIPGFGLTGSLYAETEFEPWEWLVAIGPDGLAQAQPCTRSALWRHDRRQYVRRVTQSAKWKLIDFMRRRREAFLPRPR